MPFSLDKTGEMWYCVVKKKQKEMILSQNEDQTVTAWYEGVQTDGGKDASP